MFKLTGDRGQYLYGSHETAWLESYHFAKLNNRPSEFSVSCDILIALNNSSIYIRITPFGLVCFQFQLDRLLNTYYAKRLR